MKLELLSASNFITYALLRNSRERKSRKKVGRSKAYRFRDCLVEVLKRRYRDHKIFSILLSTLKSWFIYQFLHPWSIFFNNVDHLVSSFVFTGLACKQRWCESMHTLILTPTKKRIDHQFKEIFFKF